MSAWERYANEDAPDRLVQLAILHAEFEALHPFMDGNGRLGRMLIPLYMGVNKLIQSPMFYVSAYHEENRDEYYRRLLAVSRENDWTGWCVFFLRAVQAQAEENQKQAEGIFALYNAMKRRVSELTHSQYAIHALDWIFEHPIFRSSDFVANAEIPEPTAKRILSCLGRGNVLKTFVASSGRRPATFCFPDLLNIAEDERVFSVSSVHDKNLCGSFSLKLSHKFICRDLLICELASRSKGERGSEFKLES